jgi:hypothetical protein
MAGARKVPQICCAGQAQLAAHCGKTDLCFRPAQEPEGVGPEKYDETAAAMIAQPKYGSNLCERALQRAVLHRKNALFFRTLHGAEVGDLFMTPIHTCQLCGANLL